MSKRNQIIEESADSKALKALRLKSDLSVRKVADEMGISKTRVSQMESGRDNISKEYILKFLDAIELSWDDWVYQISKHDKKYGLREKCHELLNVVETSKLEKVYDLLIHL